MNPIYEIPNTDPRVKVNADRIITFMRNRFATATYELAEEKVDNPGGKWTNYTITFSRFPGDPNSYTAITGLFVTFPFVTIGELMSLNMI